MSRITLLYEDSWRLFDVVDACILRVPIGLIYDLT